MAQAEARLGHQAAMPKPEPDETHQEARQASHGGRRPALTHRGMLAEHDGVRRQSRPGACHTRYAAPSYRSATAGARTDRQAGGWRMGLLEGKKALIFGVANDHSIAWGIARALHDAGRRPSASARSRVAASRSGSRRWQTRSGPTFVEACDVQDDDQIAHVFERWREVHGRLDILVHALAFARREDLDGAFVDTSRDGFAPRSTCQRLLARRPDSRRAAAADRRRLVDHDPVLLRRREGRRQLQRDGRAPRRRSRPASATSPPTSGRDGIRVNAISAGPVRTLSASGIAGFQGMYGEFADVAPLRRNIDIAGRRRCRRVPRRAAWPPR